MTGLHPQARALIEAAAAAGLPPWHTLPVAEARAAFRSRQAPVQGEAPPVGQAVDRMLEASDRHIPARVYRPPGREDAKLPIYVHFHGGGWVFGGLDSHDVLCRHICIGSGVLVVSVDYRLAPEHSYPAALDDAWESVRWVAANGAALNADTGCLAVGGDSAGGTLAATVCRRARDEGGPDIRFQVLIYPATDMTLSLPSMTELAQGTNFTRDAMEWFRDLYLPDEGLWTHADASPLFAGDLSGLPPALIVSAGFDPLRDDAEAYAAALTAAGVATEHICYGGMIHGFLSMPAVLDDGREATARVARAIGNALSPITG